MRWEQFLSKNVQLLGQIWRAKLGNRRLQTDLRKSMGGKLEEVSVLVYKLEALRRQDTHPHRHDFNMYILNDF